ncbi:MULTISPECIES: hypothetical protein [unclassified Vibrio]|uniref:hypothetical protein n=2 Tax=Vibrio TaxID=662 RepID=UPI001361A09D|nr:MULTISPECIES: hypothetical protein [unclassified Vibrio]NAW56028.1 hypothetical protein [Vibrio sp. V36_P2S2PM302]NAX26905.1 hypothetical protein [Vibrio sp. V38_P2S17PM301]
MNKKILISANVATVIACGALFWVTKSHKVDPEFQVQLDWIAYDHLMNPGRTDRTPNWKINIEMPASPPQEHWGAVYKQPQIMFNYGRDGTIYTMNMNGTDIRLLLDREELGKLPTGYNIRSSNGRYLSTHYAYNLDLTPCLIFDLKERKIVNELRSCWDGTFSKDSQSYYYSDTSPAHRQPKKVDLKSGNISNVLPENLTIDGTTYYPETQTQAFMINEALNLLIWSGAKKNPSGEIIERVQAGFDLETLQLKEVKNYLVSACQDGFDYNPNRDLFICGYRTRNENQVFLFENPEKEIENAPVRNVIKKNAWYFNGFANNYDNTLLRYRQPNEAGMFDKIKYYYELEIGYKDDYDRLSHLNLFIPDNLASQFDTFDLKSFFPAIPTQEQYDESYQRQLKARKEGKY